MHEQVHATSIEEEMGVFTGRWSARGPVQQIASPIDGQLVGRVTTATPDDLEEVLSASQAAFLYWRTVPMPKRAEVVRQIGEELRSNHEELAHLVSLEMGKTLFEARGEVQEMVDVCDFAVGLGRQIGGLVLPSERPGHRLQEQWHPLGVVGLITAFNFPVAVWAWNTALALVCGDTVVWKPSSKTPLSAIACTRIAARVLERTGHPAAITTLVVGRGGEIGDRLVADPRVALVSYTGSVPTGRRIGRIVQERFGRPLLELGGNNAVIVTPSADVDQALEAVYFGAVGTSGQRCTTTRRLILHDSLYDSFVTRLADAFRRTPIGDPRQEGILMGPLVDQSAVATMQAALDRVRAQGGRVVAGGEVLDRPGCYVTPCLVEAPVGMLMAREETFAPILYVFKYHELNEAIRIQNDVPQGLSSAIFTNDLREAERFVGPAGSDCGIANVNAGTSGAEVGGAFGGEKETGGGRECGSDAWKAYMRRQTTVVNGSGTTALAQGIRFELR
jgi:aldehyde dehydrogenase (NAD+)